MPRQPRTLRVSERRRSLLTIPSVSEVNLDHLQERYGIADSIKVQELEKEKRNEIILSCLEIGTGLRQLSRLTGVTYGVINKLNKGR